MVQQFDISLASLPHTHVADGHVIGDDYLLGFVQGSLDPAEALLVATQYHIAPEAATRVKILARYADASFENIPPQTMRCSAQAFFEEYCTGSDKSASEHPKKKDCTIPAPLQAYIGENYGDIKWYTIFEEIAEKVLSIKGSKLHACVINMKKGAFIPLHAHKGDAAVLVLCGSFTDRGVSYQKGDVIFYTANPDVLHRPVAMEDCICFAVLHSPLKLRNGWQNLVYRLRRFGARSFGAYID